MTDFAGILAADLATVLGSAGSETVRYGRPGTPGQDLAVVWSDGSPDAEGEIGQGAARHHHEAAAVTSMAALPSVDRQAIITRAGVDWRILHAEPTHGVLWELSLVRHSERVTAPGKLRLG